MTNLHDFGPWVVPAIDRADLHHLSLNRSSVPGRVSSGWLLAELPQRHRAYDSREGDRDAPKEVMLEIRKVVVHFEETRSAAGREVGSYVENLGELEALGAEVAAFLAGRAVAALGTDTTVTAYGKGAIVGLDGELEHAAAILHPRFGAPVRAAIGGGAALIPSTKKVAGAGASLTMPITNKDDIWSFDEMDAAEITIPDAPRPDEVVVCVVLASGGRPHARTRKPV